MSAQPAVSAAHLADLVISQDQLRVFNQKLGLLDQRLDQIEATLSALAAQVAESKASSERTEALLQKVLDRLAPP